MTTDSVDHSQKIANVGADGRYRSFVGVGRPQALYHMPDHRVNPARTGARTRWIVDAQSDARARLPRVTDEFLHRVAVYVAGGLIAGGVVLAARNVGSERHTWWGWLLIGVPVGWLSFLALVALTFGMLRIAVGTLRLSASLVARMSTPARIGLPAFLIALAGALVVLVGPGAARHAVATLADFLFPYATVIAVGGWLAVISDGRRHDARRRWPS
ncbi:MAG: hypothetical protein J2P17_02190 [Mycobacterium sp.]|nr:hypothetical protein [Mycobacterium sp.]